MVTIEKFYTHAINRDYMSGIDRDKSRVKATAEVFTPDALVQEILDKIHELTPDAFTDETKTFVDPSCGDGQFLVWVVFYKLMTQVGQKFSCSDDLMNLDITDMFEQALRTTYGVDLMPDNVELTKKRLLCGQEQFRHIVDKNIVCANALTYDFSFE